MLTFTLTTQSEVDQVIQDASRDGYLVVMVPEGGGAHPRVRPAVVVEGREPPFTIRVYADDEHGPGQWVPISQAARIWGITRQAVHARIAKGTARWRRSQTTGRLEVRI